MCYIDNQIMGDPVVSGFIGAGIDNKTTLILHHISINGVSCTEELESLKNLVIRIQPIITQIQQYRPTLNRNNGICTSQCFNQASTVSSWLRKLDVLLRQALEVVQRCAIPKYKVFSRYQSSRRITRLISDIERHMALSPLALLALIPELTKERMQTISEPLIVGQDEAFSRLEQLVIDAEFSRIGVVGKDGSGKSLLLKRVFNSKAVRDNFSDGLLLWLTVSKSPSFTSLRSDLCSQITRQTNGDMVKDMNEETVKLWLNVNMKEQRFALFLDDLWEEGAKLLEELGVVGHLMLPSGSKIIVSSRDRSVLLEIGVNAETSTIKMEDLIEDDSWRLFTFHAFPYNYGHLSASVDDETARLVCAKCEGLPLAIKAVGRVMAGIADAKEWELAVRKLLTANSQERQAVYDILRLVYDALGRDDVNLQLCFLYIAAAFPKSQVVDVERQVLPLWVGEGFLRTKKPQYLPEGHDPFELGRNYVKILADRCLIQSTVRDIDGRVLYFRMHGMLRDLGKQIVGA